MPQQWTVRQSLWFLIGSTLLTLSLSGSGYYFWKQKQRSRLLDPCNIITSILQTGPEKEALKTSYLAELLELSADQPKSLYALNLRKAKEKLLACPLIADAEVKAYFPSTVYIDYEVRKPIGWLSDYENIAIDKDGYLFPVTPYLSPKELPEIYLGLPPFGSSPDRFGRSGGLWQTALSDPYFALAMKILDHLEHLPGLRVKRIDVSNAFSESLGTREIVLFTEEDILIEKGEREVVCTFPKILRLAPKEYSEQLAHFLSLKKGMMEEYKRQLASAPEVGRFSPRIVDLRIPQLAFVENR